MIVTGGNNAGEFLRLIGSGREFGLKHIEYAYQKGQGGIADALGLAKDFAAKSKVVVVLGDNIIEKSIYSNTKTNKYAGLRNEKVIALVELQFTFDYQSVTNVLN